MGSSTTCCDHVFDDSRTFAICFGDCMMFCMMLYFCRQKLLIFPIFPKDLVSRFTFLSFVCCFLAKQNISTETKNKIEIEISKFTQRNPRIIFFFFHSNDFYYNKALILQ